MENCTPGWVVINIGHPRTGDKYIVTYTFSYKRSEAIKMFISGSGNDWNYWKKKFNFRVVRADTTVSVNTGFYPEYFKQ